MLNTLYSVFVWPCSGHIFYCRSQATCVIPLFLSFSGDIFLFPYSFSFFLPHCNVTLHTARSFAYVGCRTAASAVICVAVLCYSISHFKNNLRTLRTCSTAILQFPTPGINTPQPSCCTCIFFFPSFWKWGRLKKFTEHNTTIPSWFDALCWLINTLMWKLLKIFQYCH